jgi:hypothetical protein
MERVMLKIDNRTPKFRVLCNMLDHKVMHDFVFKNTSIKDGAKENKDNIS